MSNDIPAWVTALSYAGIAILVLIVLGVIFFKKILPWATQLTASALASAIVHGMLVRPNEALEQFKRDILDAENLLNEAKAITVTAAAFEIDETLPLKMRQGLSAKKVAMLQASYSNLLNALKVTYVHLEAQRGYQSDNTSSHNVKVYADRIRMLNESIAAQLEQIEQHEVLMDEWGAAHNRISMRYKTA